MGLENTPELRRYQVAPISMLRYSEKIKILREFIGRTVLVPDTAKDGRDIYTRGLLTRVNDDGEFFLKYTVNGEERAETFELHEFKSGCALLIEA